MEKLGQENIGSGYDICGKYASVDSIKRKIFDLTKIPERNIRRRSDTGSDVYTIVGDTIDSYQKELSGKVGLSGDYNLFSASVESSFSQVDRSVSESSFASIQVCMWYETWVLDTTDLKYMYPDVLDDFKTKDGKWLIEKYGGAILTGMKIGGRWNDNLIVNKLHEQSTLEVAESLKANYTTIGGEVSANAEKKVGKMKSIASRGVSVNGGNPEHVPDNLDEWKASVKDRPTFMDFTIKGLTFIWEIFAEEHPDIKEKLEEGFKKYLEDHSVKPVSKKDVIVVEFTEGYLYDSNRSLKLELYKPRFIDNSCYYVGASGNNRTVAIIREIIPKFKAVHKPIDWECVWSYTKGYMSPITFSCWLPIGPTGYKALGCYCHFKADRPSEEETKGMVLVHWSLLEILEPDRATTVWSTPNEDKVLKCQTPHEALWPAESKDHPPRLRTFKTIYYKD